MTEGEKRTLIIYIIVINHIIGYIKDGSGAAASGLHGMKEE
jgi:hypothetical protein